MSDNIQVFCTYVRDTKLGVCVEHNGQEVWLPKSQCNRKSGELEAGSELVLELPEWLAREKELLSD